MHGIVMVSLVAGAYVFYRVVLPLRVHGGWKFLAGLALLLLALRHVLLRWWGGPSFFAPDVPPWLLYGSAGLYVAFLIFFCGVLGAQVLRYGALRFLPGWRQLSAEVQQRVFHRLHGMLLVAASVLGALGVQQGLSTPRVVQRELSFPCRETLRLAVISDIHACKVRSPEFVRELVRLTQEQQPDLVLLLGDFVDGAPEVCAASLAPLRELHARLGVFGVSGNHDYYSGYERWRPVLGGLGVRMLDNAHVLLEDQGVALAGVTDESALRAGLEMPNLPKALEGIPEGVPTVLLAHRPIVAREAAALGRVQLQLSGHLHGGLVWGLGLVVAAMDAGFRAGFYRVEGMPLFVSPGVGTSSRTPFRLGVPPEITILTLRPEERS